MSEVRRVKITLTPAAREAAIEMRQIRGIATHDTFEGPDFENAIAMEITEGFVIVGLDDGTEYGYPVSTVARIAKYGS